MKIKECKQCKGTGVIITEDFNTYKVGDRFKEKDGDIYILAQTNPGMCCLISLKDGNRWIAPIKVSNTDCISADEVEIIQGHHSTKGWFKLIEKKS